MINVIMTLIKKTLNLCVIQKKQSWCAPRIPSDPQPVPRLCVHVVLECVLGSSVFFEVTGIMWY